MVVTTVVISACVIIVGALSEMPGHTNRTMDSGKGRITVTGKLLSCSLHIAGDIGPTVYA